MQNLPVTLRLDEAPIDPGCVESLFSKRHGAVASFLGVVRELEDGRALCGIRYTYYERMARMMLNGLVDQATGEFGDHGLYFHHRVGFVAVAAPSVLVAVSSPHSPAAMGLCQFYLKAVKTTLPIWKEPVFVDPAPSS